MEQRSGPARSKGERLFVSDFHPRDIDDWPDDALEAILVCSRTLEHRIAVWDSTRLPMEVRPDLLFQPAGELQARLSADTDGVPLFATTRQFPEFFGQPVAIAYYEDYERAFFANQHLRESSHFEVDYKHNPELAQRFSLDDDLKAWKLFQFPKSSDGHVSFIKAGSATPAVMVNQASLKPFSKTGQPGMLFHKEKDPDRLAWEALSVVRDSLKAPVYQHKTGTQLGDNAFLEPEAGLAWYDKAAKTLHLRLGSQNINLDVSNAATVLKNYFRLDAQDPQQITIKAQNHDMGGGFGGRNGSLFASYLAVAAVHANGRAIRLRWDRFQQFVLGLKRHASAVESTFKVNPETGKFEALEAFMVLGAGVHRNLSPSIVGLGTAHLTGPYKIPMTALHGVASLRPHTPCGPSRGFGIPQACVHIETLVDRVAHDLQTDPITLRLKNVFSRTDLDPSGYPLDFHVANREVLERAAVHPVWQKRQQRQAEMRERGVCYGVGFAASMEAYGSTKDEVFGAIELNPDGRIVVHTDMSEMGQGSRRTLASIIAQLLGQQPEHDDLVLSDATFFTNTFGRQREFDRSTSTASKTAFTHLHAVREAADLLMEEGFLEAARRILGCMELPAKPWWRDGDLVIDHNKTITRQQLLDAMKEYGLCTGVNCHAYFKNGWYRTATIDGVPTKTPRFINALAKQHGFAADWKLINVEVVPRSEAERRAASLQRSLYASAAHLIEIIIDRVSGQLTVLSCHSLLDAGDVISPALVEGQAEGGFAMGLGFALSEQIPEDPRDADFMNFHTYRAPRFRILAPVRHTIEYIGLPAGESILTGQQPQARSKGIAEAVMTTVAPALANAIADASGNYDWLNGLRLPITRHAILKAFEDSA